jgi:hypothetical protein
MWCWCGSWCITGEYRQFRFKTNLRQALKSRLFDQRKAAVRAVVHQPNRGTTLFQLPPKSMQWMNTENGGNATVRK